MLVIRHSRWFWRHETSQFMLRCNNTSRGPESPSPGYEADRLCLMCLCGDMFTLDLWVYIFKKYIYILQMNDICELNCLDSQWAQWVANTSIQLMENGYKTIYIYKYCNFLCPLIFMGDKQKCDKLFFKMCIIKYMEKQPQIHSKCSEAFCLARLRWIKLPCRTA